MVPVTVTATERPCNPDEGLTEVSVGARLACAKTVNGTAALRPPDVATEILCWPVVAFGAMSIVAVILVLSDTTTLEKTMPVPAAWMTAGDTRFVPVRVRWMEVPCTPELVLKDVRVGCPFVPAVTAKGTDGMSPPGVVTETL